VYYVYYSAFDALDNAYEEVLIGMDMMYLTEAPSRGNKRLFGASERMGGGQQRHPTGDSSHAAKAVSDVLEWVQLRAARALISGSASTAAARALTPLAAFAASSASLLAALKPYIFVAMSIVAIFY
jgi:hypothetical protein